jgi:hypothetical protein
LLDHRGIDLLAPSPCFLCSRRANNGNGWIRDAVSMWHRFLLCANGGRPV